MGQKCGKVVDEMKQTLQLVLPDNNTRIDMNISDLLIEKPLECKLNMFVHIDENLKDDDRRVEIGLATLARSQYLIFDYDRQYIGFGGPHDITPTPRPTPEKGMSPIAIFLLIVMFLLILAVCVYGVKRYRDKKLEDGLLQMDGQGADRASRAY